METLVGLPKELVDFALGLAIGALAVVVPFRKVDARPDRLWDLIGVVTGVASAIAVKTICGALMEVAWGAHVVERWCLWVYALPWWVVLPVYFVLADFGGYLTHRWMHTRALWPVHAWHHSSAHVSWLSGLRGSPLHVLILIAPYYLLGFLLPYDAPVTVASAASAFTILNQHYIHANIRVPFARVLEWVFVTPRAHFVHHSAFIPRTDSNYGFVFSVWDRLFGTWTPPDEVPEGDPLGLDYDAANWRLLLGLPSRIPRETPLAELDLPSPLVATVHTQPLRLESQPRRS